MGILVALPIAAAIAVLDRRKIEEFLFWAIGMIISLIFLFGYFGNTLPGVYAGIVLAGVSLLYCIFVLIKDRARFKESVLTTGFVGILVCVLVAAVICFGMKDLGAASDLYRVYAPQLINMYMYDNLGVGEPAHNYELLYSAPICGAWCYFCNKFWSHYSDCVIMWSRHIFIISAFAPLYSHIRKGEWKKTLLISFIIMNFPYIIHPTLCYLNDVTLGCTVSYGTLMTMKLFRDRNRSNDIGYLAACCWGIVATCLIKRMGAVFIYGMVSMAAVYTVKRFMEKKDDQGIIKRLVPLFAMFFSLAMVLVFNCYRQKYYVDDTFYTIFPVIAFIGLVVMGIAYYFMIVLIKKGRYVLAAGMVSVVIVSAYFLLLGFGAHYSDTDTSREVISGYMIEWFNELSFDNGINMPDPMFMILFILMMFVLGYLINKGKVVSLSKADDIGITSGMLILGALLAAATILCSYLQYELLPKVHTYRYLRPAILVMVVVVIYELLCIESRHSTYIVVISTIVLILLLPANNIVVKLLPEEGEKRWDVFKNMYSDAGIQLTTGTNILYEGKDYYAIYASFPAGAVWYKPEEEDPDELKNWVLDNGSEYLLLDDYDEDFPYIYQEMFEGGRNEIRENAIYDVVVEEDGVRFVRRKGHADEKAE